VSRARREHWLETAVSTAITCRVLMGLALDGEGPDDSAWISVLIGAVLALAALVALDRICSRLQNGAPLRLALQMVFSLLATADAAQVIECACASAGYAAFSHVAAWVLALPLAASLLRCAWLGAASTGYAAALVPRVLAPLIALIVAFQLPYYRSCWLFPVMGRGVGPTLRTGLHVAGWLAVPGGLGALLRRDGVSFRPFRMLAFAVPASIGLILLRLMMAPPLFGSRPGRAVLLDALLTNGRAPLYCQLPMICAWLLGLLNLGGFECAAAGELLSRCLSRRCGRAASLVPAALAALLAILDPPWLASASPGGWVLWTVAAAAIVVGFDTIRKRGDRGCGASESR